MIKLVLIRPFGILIAALALFVGGCASPRVQHVFIVSIDGGKPAVIQDSKMPCLEKMVSEGAHTWTAETIFPSITLPSHTSMLTGVGPDKHRILWNDYVPSNGIVKVPTVFSEAKKKGYSTAMFVGKEKFRHLVQSNTVDEFDFNPRILNEVSKVESDGSEPKKESTVMSKSVAADAATYIIKHKPNMCFIHLTDADAVGHKSGWGSQNQKAALVEVDNGLQTVLLAIRDAGIANESVVIVSADHGGHARTHGSRDPQDMLIPWVAWGHGVKKGFTITSPVTTYDTAATAMWLLDIPLPPSLDGKPVTSAFE